MKVSWLGWAAILLVLGATSCVGPGIARATPDIYMTAIAGAQTRAAIASLTAFAFLATDTATPAFIPTDIPVPLPTVVPFPTPTVVPFPTPTAVLFPTPTAVLFPTPLPPPPPPPPVPAPPPIAGTGWVSLINLHTQKCMAAPANPDADNASVLQATCNGAPNQLWQFAPVGDGSYRIISQNSGKCLDIEFKHTEENYDLVQSRCDGGASQRWRMEQVNDYAYLHGHSRAARHAAPAIQTGSYFELVAEHSRKCADLDGWSHDDGAHILQGNCHPPDNDNQMWAMR